jgi:hypothetical protein
VEEAARGGDDEVAGAPLLAPPRPLRVEEDDWERP